MYLKYYRLRGEPFSVVADPAFWYPSPNHAGALGALLKAIESRRGLMTLMGEPGIGKTMVLRTFMERVHPQKVRAVHVSNPEASFGELMQTLVGGLGIEDSGADERLSVLYLQRYLMDQYRKGRWIVLLVDEAHRMSAATLQGLRMLGELTTASAQLLQIVLSGQHRLESSLKEAGLGAASVALRVEIERLNRRDSAGYIVHRLRKVSRGRVGVFTPRALNLLVRYGQGNPRRLNVVSDNALISGFAYQERPITAHVVKEVAREFVGAPGVFGVRRATAPVRV